VLKRPVNPRLIPLAISQTRNNEKSTHTRVPWMTAPGRSGRSATLVETMPPRKTDTSRVIKAQIPAPIPRPAAVSPIAARGSPIAVVPTAKPSAPKSIRVPLATTNPLMTPPHRTRGPIGVRRSVDATTVSVMGIVSVIGSAYIAMMDSVLCGFPTASRLASPRCRYSHDKYLALSFLWTAIVPS